MLKKYIYIIGAIFFGFIFFILCIPMILSSNWGNEQLLNLINKNISGKVKITSTNFSWLGPQIIEGLSLESLTEEEMLKIDRIKLETSLFTFIIKKGIFHSLSIENFYIHFTQEPFHASNLDLALGLPVTSKIYKKIPNPIDLTLENTDFNLTFNELNVLNSFFSKGSTKEGSQKGDFIIDLSLDPKASHLKGHFSQFPVGIIDTLLQLENPKYAGVLLTLLGNTVNISIEQQTNLQDFKTSIFSENIKAELHGKIEESVISLSQPGNLNIQLNPETFSTLLKNNNCTVDLGINKPLNVNLIIKKFKFPLSFLENNHEIDPSQLEFIASLNSSETQIIFSDLNHSLNLHDLQMTIETPENLNLILFDLKAEASKDSDPVQLLLNGRIIKPLNKRDFLDLYKNIEDLSLNLNNIPTQLIDQLFFCNDSLISSLMGNSLSCKINMKSLNNEAFFNFSLDAEKIFMEEMSWKLSQNLSLIKPSSISSKFNQNNFLPPSLSKLFSESPFLLTLNLKEIQIPLSFSQALSYPSLSTLISYIKPSYLEGQLIIKEIESKENFFGRFKISESTIDFKGNPYQLGFINMNSNLDLRENAFLTSLFGPQLTIQNNMTTQWNGINHWNLIPWTLNLSSDQLHGTLKGKVINNELYLTTSSDVRFNLTQNVFDQFGIKSSKHQISLKETVPVKIHFSSMDEPISLNDLDHLVLAGSIQLDLASFSLDDALENEQEDLYLKDLNIHWNLNGPNNKLSFKFSGKTQFNSLASQYLVGTINFFKWHSAEGISLDNTEIGMKIELNKIPTIFLESFFHYEYLIELLGKAIDLQLNSYFSLNKKNADFNLSIVGEKFESNLTLKLDENLSIVDSSPANLNITITPEQFQLLRKISIDYLDNESFSDQLQLKTPTTFSLKINNLKIPIKDHQFSFPESIKAEIDIDKLYVENQNNKSLYLEKIVARINSKNLKEQLNFYLKAFSKNDQFLEPIKISGEVSELLTSGNNINLSGLSLNLNAEIHHLPVSLICELGCSSLRFQKKLEALIGEWLNLTLFANLDKMNGPFHLNVNGTNGTFKLQSEIKNGFLTLKTPLESTIKITPSLGKFFLEEIIPVLGDVVESDNLITVFIDPKGFLFPVNSYDFSKIQMNNIIVNLGKISFSKTSQLASIFKLLQPSYNESVSVYFTPLYMEMNSGILTIKRMDLLVSNQFPLAIWGKINFIKNKLDMWIGITARALNQALNISGLDPNYMMQLPIKGNLHEAFINKTKAAARISALIAQTTGSTQGILLGTFLDIAGGKLTEEKPPEPTTNPLPWELSLETENTQNLKKIEPKQKTKKNEKNSLFKEKASEILNSIFK